MKHWIRILFIFLFFSLIFLPKNTFAHPGNTAADGCHYCRTNCDRWGVPWNQRHCHGGGIIKTVQKNQPTSTPRPTSIPTKKPTLVPTKLTTAALTNSPAPTSTPILTSTTNPTPIITNTSTLGPTKTEEISPVTQPKILGQTDTQKPTEPPKASDTF